MNESIIVPVSNENWAGIITHDLREQFRKNVAFLKSIHPEHKCHKRSTVARLDVLLQKFCNELRAAARAKDDEHRQV